MTDTSDADAHLRPLIQSPTMREYLAEIWARRDFGFALPFEQLRSSHLNTLLGNVWHLGNPLLTAGVYYFIFGVFFGANTQIENYVLWLVIGVFTYGLTASSVLGGARSIHDGQGLMRSFRFPRAILPISNVIGNVLTFAFQFAVIVLVAFLSGVGVSNRWFALPVILAIHSALNLGGALIAARLNESAQDVQQLIPFVFRLLQYTSGVMFSVDRILATDNVWLRRLVLYNPLVSLIDMYRWAIMGTPVATAGVVSASLISVAVLVFGLRFFRAAEHRYGRA